MRFALFIPALLIQVPLPSWASETSVLSPHGQDAMEIAQLTWLLVAFCAAVFGIVLLMLWLAMGGSGRVRARIATSTTVIAGGIAFPAVTLTALFTYGMSVIGASVLPIDDRERVDVTGEQWWWRVSYLGPDGNRFASANEITIPVGRPVTFSLSSADVIHSFWVPSLGGKVDMIPGRTTQLRLTAIRPGTYRGQCAEYCGGPHTWMTLQINALAEAEFTAWLAKEAGPAVEPATETERQGRSLFLSAGCGACHTIRGTQADGRIGPDLTHLGARRFVGVETLPMTRASLARFIADGQHVKPGNLMPPFRVFSDEQRDALTAYLVSLR